MTKEEFIEELKKINIFLTSEQLKRLDKFYHLLIKWNQKINLTRITDEKEVYLKHFYDSLTLTKIIDLNKVDRLCDVGSGAGFPGIVLKICYPNLNITLLDSLNKRILYLNDIIKQLNLENIRAIHTRSEEHKEKYDVVTARAVASLNKLIPLTINLLKNNGVIIAMKANVIEEIQESKNTLKKYHCQIIKKQEFTLPKEKSIRNLILIKKI